MFGPKKHALKIESTKTEADDRVYQIKKQECRDEGPDQAAARGGRRLFLLLSGNECLLLEKTGQLEEATKSDFTEDAYGLR
jgi:hypothetical protein